MRLLLPLILLTAAQAPAEGPFFVTYTHQMEEPGNLEIALDQSAAAPRGGRGFLSSLLELEYGVKTWWTTEFYLSGQQTAGEGALFTGYRIENRFRPLMGERLINPVLYFEYSDSNGADKSLKEIVGHDTLADQLTPNGESRREREREVETKLILSSNVRNWSAALNLISEKNLANEPWEFGYSFGLSRPLALAASPDPCRACRENFAVGLELFGGVGTATAFGLRETSHYAAPVLAWGLPSGMVLKVSPAFGLNGSSYRVLMRFAVEYEAQQFGPRLARFLRGLR